MKAIYGLIILILLVAGTKAQGEKDNVEMQQAKKHYLAVSPDYVQAAKQFESAAKKGDIDAKAYLGMMYYRGYGVKRDYSIAVKWLRAAAEANQARALSDLGHAYAFGRGVSRNYPKAVELYRKSAQLGNPFGQYRLGWMYLKGKGFRKDREEAIKYFRMALPQMKSLAQQNDVEAQYYLAAIYLLDERDRKKAAEWYEKASERGHSKAMVDRGRIDYDNGDYDNAIIWYEKALKWNEPAAMVSLGAMHFYGQGYPQNKGIAFNWILQAAELGYAPAQYMAAEMYYYGDGVEQDREKAQQWYKKSAEQDFTRAKKKLSAMKKNYMAMIAFFTVIVCFVLFFIYNFMRERIEKCNSDPMDIVGS